jgi:tripartite-type tricarboxylate transporter receptor subunit TctC
VTKKIVAVALLLIIAVLMPLQSCTSKSEQNEAPARFFKGKTIDLVTSEEAGSNTDLLARVIAPYLAEGTGATVIVTNRRGAGGLEGMNYLYQAEPDGLTLGITATVKFVSNKLLNEPAATYEIDKFSYIMILGNRPNFFFVSPDGPYQSMDALKAAQGLKLGGGSPSGYISLAGLTVIKVLGLDARVITGFSGGAERALAVKRGEIDGYVINMTGAAPYVESGMVKPLFALAAQRDPLMPDVPAITELADISEEDLALVKLWETTLVGSSLFLTPPGITEEKLAFLRDMAAKWTQDEKFRGEIDTVSGYELKDREYVTGEDVAGLMLGITGTMDKFQTIFADLIKDYRD